MIKNSLILLSGGMDSVSLLYLHKHLISLAVTFDYGSKHREKEIECAKYHCQKLGIEHIIVPLNVIQEHFSSSLIEGGEAIPDGHYAAESMKSTVVPFRNGIMLSICIGLAESRGLNYVYIANHAGDHFIYPDCRLKFIEAMNSAAEEGTFERIKILSPFVSVTKSDIASMGAAEGVDFTKTWSCYKGGDKHCGTCGTCVERKEAFASANLIDPTIYQQ